MFLLDGKNLRMVKWVYYIHSGYQYSLINAFNLVNLLKLLMGLWKKRRAGFSGKFRRGTIVVSVFFYFSFALNRTANISIGQKFHRIPLKFQIDVTFWFHFQAILNFALGWKWDNSESGGWWRARGTASLSSYSCRTSRTSLLTVRNFPKICWQDKSDRGSYKPYWWCCCWRSYKS